MTGSLAVVAEREPDGGWSLDARPPSVIPFSTVLFSDIEGFAPLTDRLGDARALHVARTHGRITRDVVRAHGGVEVRSRGDGFVVVFASPWCAVRCAMRMQRAFADRRAWRPEEPVKVRIGLHAGDVFLDGRDFHGKTMIVAARVAAEARGGEILVSTSVKAMVGGSFDVAVDGGRDTPLKGLRGTHRLFRVVDRLARPAPVIR
jgi:class 3 adenylate cyclase